MKDSTDDLLLRIGRNRTTNNKKYYIYTSNFPKPKLVIITLFSNENVFLIMVWIQT